MKTGAEGGRGGAAGTVMSSVCSVARRRGRDPPTCASRSKTSAENRRVFGVTLPQGGNDQQRMH